MIIQEKLVKSYELCSSKAMIYLKCDYCGKEFLRNKRSRDLSNKNIDKDSCSKECKKIKRKEIDNYLASNEEYQKKLAEGIKIGKEKNIARFGCENYFESEEFKSKRPQFLKDKYGTDKLYLVPSILDKYKKTCLEKWDVDNYSKTKKFSEKIKDNNLKRSQEDKDKITEKKEQTSLLNCGKKYYTQTAEYLSNRIKKCIKENGVLHHSQIPENREKAKKTCLKKYGVTNYSKTPEAKQRFIENCIKNLGVPNPFLLKKNQIYGKSEKELKEWINSLGFNFQVDYSILCPKELDLYDSNLNLAIEYSGLFWHNELSPCPRLSDYHYNKYKKCSEQGVRLITIFEDEWKFKNNQCKSILKSILKVQSNIIFARKCNLLELKKEDFNYFCNLYHLQGNNNLGLVFYGLYYEKELIACMSLGMHHRNKNLLTLDRLCFKSDYNIIGGASKLFKPCLNWAKEKGYKEIISWSDNRWSQGAVYEKLGFKLDKELSPDYSYVNLKNAQKRVSKQSQKKSNTNCPINKTEHEWAIENELGRIWDCGKKRWAFNI